VRVDDGIAEGGTITPYYDAMVAKLIAHGRDRADAVRKLVAALDASPLLGVRNNGRFLRDLLQHEAFTQAQLTTAMLDDWSTQGAPIVQRPLPDDATWLIAAAARATRDGTGWRPASVSRYDMALACEGVKRTLRLRTDNGGADMQLDGKGHTLQIVARDDRWLTLSLDGRQCRALVADDGHTLHLALDGQTFAFTEVSPWPQRDAHVDPRRARAPVAGTVAQVLVRAGDSVAAGQPLVSVEAMKMEMWLNAAAAGTVRAVHALPKATVASGAVLVELDIPEAT
jgi:geranyl-CoA carboxylase alpha subunit